MMIRKQIVVMLFMLMTMAQIGFAQSSTCPQGTLSIVTAADYSGSSVAPSSIVSMFATNIATGVFTASDQSPVNLPITLGGVSATITDTSGNVLPISLIAVAQGQVNAVLPSDVQSGVAVVNLTTSSGAKICGTVNVNTVAPSLFTADQTGAWLAAAQVVITHSDGSQSVMDAVAQYSSTLVFNGSTWSNWIPIPINLGTSTDITVLELFGTGIRGVNSYTAALNKGGFGPPVAVNVCTQLQYCTPYGTLTVLYAGAQGAAETGSFYGLDQINVVLPYSLAGSGMVFVEVGVASSCPGCGLVPWQVLTPNIVSIDIQ
ncbi:MAG TPA: hypothetical protein VME43_23500 [Bryobacteraceae bacterium]|nr:hypothetical protein [Bryobacteraceae bacterium]